MRAAAEVAFVSCVAISLESCCCFRCCGCDRFDHAAASRCCCFRSRILRDASAATQRAWIACARQERQQAETQRTQGGRRHSRRSWALLVLRVSLSSVLCAFDSPRLQQRRQFVLATCSLVAVETWGSLCPSRSGTDRAHRNEPQSGQAHECALARASRTSVRCARDAL